MPPFSIEFILDVGLAQCTEYRESTNMFQSSGVDKLYHHSDILLPLLLLFIFKTIYWFVLYLKIVILSLKKFNNKALVYQVILDELMKTFLLYHNFSFVYLKNKMSRILIGYFKFNFMNIIYENIYW